MTVTKITFFDIPTILPVPTSPNTWKVRLALNYKGLNYVTCWVETTDIETVCKRLRIPPTSTSPTGEPRYTLPAIIDRTRPNALVILSDSTPIIEYLERAYPDPEPNRALLLPHTHAFQALVEAHIATQITYHLIPLMVMYMLRSKTPRDRLHFRSRMEAAFGRKLEEIELQGEERVRAWARMKEAFSLLAGCLRRNGGGAFFTGERPSLADFTLGALILALKYDSQDEAWSNISGWDDGQWVEFVAALNEWVVVR